METFLRFLDPELCDITETIEKDGLRTLEMEYKFQNYLEDKELFRMGNKIWVNNDSNISDCLYVINTNVEKDIYNENCFKFEIEEVLVELNNAPLFLQTELTTANGFNLTTTAEDILVTVNWNALNYWFGDYFNIGVVQKCLSEYASKISVSGSVNRMELLRYIESETGNVFVTRYEKDTLTNTIHRYLDFLNPINVSKDWELNIMYDFQTDVYTGVTDSNNNPTTDNMEDVFEDDDIVIFPEYKAPNNINPDKVRFRLTDGVNVLKNQNGLPMQWDSNSIGFTNNTEYANIQLSRIKNNFGLIVNNRSFIIATETTTNKKSTGYIATENTPVMINNCIIPDDSYFEIYDFVNDKILFQTRLNYEIGTVHPEILDFGFNLENVTIDVDESETFMGISPVISINDNSNSLNSISRSEVSQLINDWLNLSVEKGDYIPLILEKFNVNGSSLSDAQYNLGPCEPSGNYWKRPYRPNDNEGSSYEFWRGVKYWRAPFTKYSGDFHVLHDKNNNIEYTNIIGRPDDSLEMTRDINPKIGNVETSEENIYSIYADVANMLQEVCTPNIDIDVDIANLIKGQFNQYELHDKVYIKLPESQELITARVTRTEKKAHDIAKNTVKLSNYSINTVQTLQQETYIKASNVSFHYPSSEIFTAQLFNAEYDSSDTYSVQNPANKLLSFILYSVENNNVSQTGIIYTKRTDAEGKCSLPMQYDPGNYKLEIYFAGDEEYAETSYTVDINVYGVKEEPQTSKTSSSKAKTTKKSKSKSTKQQYYDKYGRSPKKKTILAIGKRSASKDGGSDKYFYETEFKNKCPHCGKATLAWSIFWAGNEKSNYGKFPITGNSEGSSAEGAIICTNRKCDADYSVFGNEHTTNGKKLTITTKTKKSSKTRAYKLKKGKMPFGEIVKTVSKKKNTSNKSRSQTVSSIASDVKEKALQIIGNKEGLAAAKEIAKWVGTNIQKDTRENFYQSPSTTLKRKRGNCCCQTWLMLEMMDAAGCTEKLTLKYIHVNGTGGGHVFSQIITNATGTKRYVDPMHSPFWGACLHNNYWGNLPGSSSTYPTKPF